MLAPNLDCIRMLLSFFVNILKLGMYIHNIIVHSIRLRSVKQPQQQMYKKVVCRI